MVVFLISNSDIEAQIADIQSKKKELAAAQASEKGVGLLESGYYDTELYDDGADKKRRYEGYNTSIAANDDIDDDDDEGLPVTKRTTYTAPKSILKDVIKQVKLSIFHVKSTHNSFTQISGKKNQVVISYEWVFSQMFTVRPIEIIVNIFHRVKEKKQTLLPIIAGPQLLTEKMNTDKNGDVPLFRLNELIHLLTVSIVFISFN